MRFKEKIIRSTLGVVLATTAVSAVSCTPNHIPHEVQIVLAQKIQKEAYVAGFEGMQPFSGYKIENLIEKISASPYITGCSTSGNIKSHLKFIEEAYLNGNQIYIIGYSAGADDARALAKLCKDKSILVDALFFLDPTYLGRPFPKKIPSNVEKIIIFRSNSFNFVGGKFLKRKNLENQATFFKNIEVPEIGHMKLPGYVTKDIKNYILLNEQSK